MSTNRLRWVWVWPLSWWLVGACGTPPGERPVATPPPAAREPATTASVVTPAASSGPPAAARRPDDDRPFERRKRVAGSSSRRIACETSWCEAGKERCEFDGDTWSCQPTSSPSTGDHADINCDDGTDCPQGQTCCIGFSSMTTSYLCVARTEINKGVSGCAVEVCTASTPYCPPGQSCQDDLCKPKAREPKAIVSGRATCGQTRCAAAQPLCVWSKGAGRCISVDTASTYNNDLTEPDGTEVGIYTCTRPSDCGAGQSCCTSMSNGDRLTRCSASCDVVNSMKVCATDAECRAVAKAVCPEGSDCMKDMACRPVENGPPGLRTCRQG